MVLVLLISTCWLGQVETARKPPAAQRVATLVRQLDDDRWDRRQQAEKTLLQMGPEILDELPPPSARLSPEADKRLARIRKQLQVKDALRATEASRVTLQGTMALKTALQTIQESTGNAMTGYSPLADQKIGIQAEQRPFWEVLDRVLDQTQVAIYPYETDQREVRLIQRSPPRAKRSTQAHYAGLFRMQPTYVSASRDLRNTAIQGLRLRLAIAWEPRTVPISITLPLSTVTARDDRGKPIEVDADTSRLNAIPTANSVSVDMELPLQLPPREAQEIASLKGAFEALVPGKSKTFVFGELEREQPQRKQWAEATVTLDEVRKTVDGRELRVGLAFDKAFNAFESHRGWMFRNDAYMRTATGERIPHEGWRLLDKDDTSIRLSFTFALDQPLSDYKFIYRTPSLITRQTIRFAFEDVSLP